MAHSNRRIDQEIRGAVRSAERVEDEIVREFRRTADQLRQAVVLKIVEHGQLDPGSIPRLKAQIDQLVQQFELRFRDLMSENQRRMFVRGIKIVDRAVNGANLTAAIPYLSEDLLNQLRQYGAELIANLTDDARRKIRNEIDLAVLGQKEQGELIEAIGRNLKDPSVFGTIANRATVIARTEINRIQQVATSRRLKQVQEQLPDMRKKWVHSFVGIPRWNHLELHEEIIPADQKFTIQARDVPGQSWEVDGPHDPILPAKEVVNCRCIIVPVVGRFQAIAPPPVPPKPPTPKPPKPKPPKPTKPKPLPPPPTPKKSFQVTGDPFETFKGDDLKSLAEDKFGDLFEKVSVTSDIVTDRVTVEVYADQHRQLWNKYGNPLRPEGKMKLLTFERDPGTYASTGDGWRLSISTLGFKSSREKSIAEELVRRKIAPEKTPNGDWRTSEAWSISSMSVTHEDKIRGTATHEFGHMLQQWMADNSTGAKLPRTYSGPHMRPVRDRTGGQKERFDDFVERWKKIRLKIDGEGIKKYVRPKTVKGQLIDGHYVDTPGQGWRKLSDYSYHKYSGKLAHYDKRTEAFAESFAAYELGKHERLPPEVKSFFDDFLPYIQTLSKPRD